MLRALHLEDSEYPAVVGCVSEAAWKVGTSMELGWFTRSVRLICRKLFMFCGAQMVELRFSKYCHMLFLSWCQNFAILLKSLSGDYFIMLLKAAVLTFATAVQVDLEMISHWRRQARQRRPKHI